MIRAASPRQRAIILDRDGTIVVDRHYLREPQQLELLPGAAQGLLRLHERGHRLVVITNQSGVGRGYFGTDAVDAVHERLRAMLSAHAIPLAGIYVCPHRPDHDCDCRKPRAGLLRLAAQELGFDPALSVVIGDKPSDVALGQGVGAGTILIADEADAADLPCQPAPDLIAADLCSAERQLAACTLPS